MDRETVNFRYHSASTGRARRITTPAMGLLCAANTWYLVGMQDREAKSYRLDRIDDLAMSSEKRPFPTEFHLQGCWEAARARFRKRLALASA